MSKSSFEDSLHQLDIVFVIDATGSMSACIHEVQERLNYLAKSIAKAPASPDVAFGAVAYRDHPPQDSTFVTRVFPITTRPADAQRRISSISAGGGGDAPEAVKDGLWDALKKGGWRSSAYKVIVLAGDAPAHENCPCQITFDQITKQARKSEIRIFAVGTSSNRLMIRQFTKLAKDTGGCFVRLADTSRLIDEILSVLRKTVIVDMEINLAIYKRRMRGVSVAVIAKEVDRPVDEVRAILASLERKGAKWTSYPVAPAIKRKKPVIKSIAPGDQVRLVARPVIIPIANPVGQPDYEVRWVGWNGAQWYELHESLEESFLKSTVVSEGPETVWRASQKPPGTYHYRVRLVDSEGYLGDWSPIQSTVVKKKGTRR